MSTAFDWRNQRSAMVKLAAPTAVDKEALEKAFMDQAYGYVANRAGELFADPYRLGFEVVFSNESSTRMVGIFAFRLKERLLYAPVFFIQGEIKGYDMAYRHWVKKFCPFTPEWTKFLLETAIQDVGRGVDRQEVGRITDNVHLERLASPPDYQKSAGFEELVKSAMTRYHERAENNELVDGWQAEWGMVVNAMAEPKGMPEPILRPFLEKAPSDMLDKVAAMLETMDPFVTDAFLKNAAAGTWDFIPEPIEKKASAEPEVLLAFLKTASADADPESYAHFCQHGYWIRDKRAAADKAVVEEELTTGTVATGIPGFGTFRMLMPGGEFRRVIASPYNHKSDFRQGGNPNVINNHVGGCFPLEDCDEKRNGNYDAGGPREIIIIDVESKNSVRWRDEGCAVTIDDSEDVDQVEGSETPSKGKAYRVFCPKSGILSMPFVVEKIESASDGVKIIQASGGHESDKFSFTLNPDAEDSSLREHILNGKCRFFEISVDKKHESFAGRYPDSKAQPGSVNALQAWAIEAGGKKVDVKKEAGLYTVTAGKHQVQDLERHEAHMLLTGKLLVDSKSAAAWLDKPGTRVVFVKDAYATQMAKEPDFRVGRDGVFGIEVETPYDEMLPTRTQQVQHPTNRIGDAHDPSQGRGPSQRGMERMPEELVLSSAPEVLAQMAKSWKVPHVLEHGAVGSLARTYDSLQLIESYIPPMEECLDRLARCLFLYYLKPQDFEKAYGSDDMASQENDFLNAFRVLGDLVLSLLRRSRGPSESQGSPVDRM